MTASLGEFIRRLSADDHTCKKVVLSFDNLGRFKDDAVTKLADALGTNRSLDGLLLWK
jgi:hypothetical protein